jgi:hypothetical protein
MSVPTSTASVVVPASQSRFQFIVYLLASSSSVWMRPVPDGSENSGQII